MRFCEWLAFMQEKYNLSRSDIMKDTSMPERTLKDHLKGRCAPNINIYGKYINGLYFRYCKKKPENEDVYRKFLQKSYSYFVKQENDYRKSV